MNDRIDRMVNELSLLRDTLGWTQAELGERLGLSRQSVNSIERGRTKMSKHLYLAICKVVEDEMEKFNTWNGCMMTRMVLKTFIEDPDSWYEEDYITKGKVRDLLNLFSGDYSQPFRTIEICNKTFIGLMVADGLESYLVTEE